ncbi:hypothetical protein H696_09009 (mitochondrion) [Fonticula alba]|uniref:Uncharacterized protein n=1 Tax=Fonticula alba TaxID=691883 RepID=A0A058YZ74_FONAL|nr:hypothetical protein H696_09009 [Fonticula alba]KCV67181.1 hypothetical protein H696_09009 [Fonticula alba]|eukprot:XP_009498415.1 hypothetical protein H696_09009 (mitochondrion) [Fonticula alba]
MLSNLYNMLLSTVNLILFDMGYWGEISSVIITEKLPETIPTKISKPYLIRPLIDSFIMSKGSLFQLLFNSQAEDLKKAYILNKTLVSEGSPTRFDTYKGIHYIYMNSHMNSYKTAGLLKASEIIEWLDKLDNKLDTTYSEEFKEYAETYSEDKAVEFFHNSQSLHCTALSNSHSYTQFYNSTARALNLMSESEYKEFAKTVKENYAKAHPKTPNKELTKLAIEATQNNIHQNWISYLKTIGITQETTQNNTPNELRETLTPLQANHTTNPNINNHNRQTNPTIGSILQHNITNKTTHQYNYTTWTNNIINQNNNKY